MFHSSVLVFGFGVIPLKTPQSNRLYWKATGVWSSHDTSTVRVTPLILLLILKNPFLLSFWLCIIFLKLIRLPSPMSKTRYFQVLVFLAMPSTLLRLLSIVWGEKKSEILTVEWREMQQNVTQARRNDGLYFFFFSLGKEKLLSPETRSNFCFPEQGPVCQLPTVWKPPCLAWMKTQCHYRLLKSIKCQGCSICMRLPPDKNVFQKIFIAFGIFFFP